MRLRENIGDTLTHILFAEPTAYNTVGRRSRAEGGRR
jgi:hypothetical protein